MLLYALPGKVKRALSTFGIKMIKNLHYAVATGVG